jgi:hypothetical protein
VNEDPFPGIAQPDWVLRYEQLRSDVLSRGQGISSAGLGLAVFLRDGITAWMRACSRAVTAPARTCAQLSTNVLPYDLRNEAVLILAGILLGNKSEANHASRCPEGEA